MTDLRELYQAVILDHNRNPRNFRMPQCHNHKAQGVNPLCGDEVQIYLQLNEAGIIEDIRSL